MGYIFWLKNDMTGQICFLPKKTDRHDITEILLKVALNTITLIPTQNF